MDTSKFEVGPILKGQTRKKSSRSKKTQKDGKGASRGEEKMADELEPEKEDESEPTDQEPEKAKEEDTPEEIEKPEKVEESEKPEQDGGPEAKEEGPDQPERGDYSTVAPPFAAPPCPSQYSTSTEYAVGDLIESDMQIYQCRPPPYEEYCSIYVRDQGWSKDEKMLWRDAWARVGSCEMLEVEGEMIEVLDDGVVKGATVSPTAYVDASADIATVERATEAPVAIEGTSAVIATVDKVIETPIADGPYSTEMATTTATVQSPPCPSAYDPLKTNYKAGDQITANCYIFRCRDAVHEMYCNIFEWSDDLLAEDDSAKDLWRDAWEEVGDCVPTQWELMEEEAANDHWDCLAR